VTTSKEEKYEELWALEQQLIPLLTEWEQAKTMQESSKKKVDQDGFVLPSQQEKANSKLILPGSFYAQQSHSLHHKEERSKQYLGGSMAARLQYLEDLANKSETSSKKILTFDKNAVEFDEIEKMLQSTTMNRGVHKTKENQPVAGALEQKMHELSSKILQLRKEMGLHDRVCDHTNAYDLNILMGGNGTYNSDGKTEEIPKEPLSKTCPHRNMKYPILLRCVVCPANYADSAKRLDTWLEFVKNQQQENKKQGA
jgi:hypothetical protein